MLRTVGVWKIIWWNILQLFPHPQPTPRRQFPLPPPLRQSLPVNHQPFLGLRQVPHLALRLGQHPQQFQEINLLLRLLPLLTQSLALELEELQVVQLLSLLVLKSIPTYHPSPSETGYR